MTEVSIADNKARFDGNDIYKMSKKCENAQNHAYIMSKKSKKNSIITPNSS